MIGWREPPPPRMSQLFFSIQVKCGAHICSRGDVGSRYRTLLVLFSAAYQLIHVLIFLTDELELWFVRECGAVAMLALPLMSRGMI